MSVDVKGITVYDKTTNEAYEDLIQFEDRGDIGNEYEAAQKKRNLRLRCAFQLSR